MKDKMLRVSAKSKATKPSETSTLILCDSVAQRQTIFDF